MFKRELADVLKQTAWFLAVIILLRVPTILLNGARGPYGAVLPPTLIAGLVFWSLFLGASLLGRERGQKAMEYALSLPHSRWGLLLRLAGPRFLVLAILWAASAALLGIAQSGHGEVSLAALTAYVAFMIGFPLFLISLSLSFPIENFIVLCLLSLFGWYTAWIAAGRLAWGPSGRMLRFFRFPEALTWLQSDAALDGSGTSLLFSLSKILLPVLPFLIALLAALPRFDIRRSARFKVRYSLVFALSLILCGLAVFGARAATDSLAHKLFYLTKNLKLVEYSHISGSAKIRGEGSSLKIRVATPGLAMAWDDGKSLFVEDWNGGFNRIDLATGKADLLCHFDLKKTPYWGQWTYGSQIAFFETGSRPGEIRLAVMDTGTKKADKHVFAHASFGRGNPALIGTSLRDGIRFWICSIPAKGRRSTLRLWADGRVEEIPVKGRLETSNMPSFVNGLLFFTGREPTVILRDNGRGFALLKEFSPGEDFSAMDVTLNRRELDAAPVSHIYAKRGRRLVRLSLETLAVEDIGAWAENEAEAWGFLIRKGGRTYFIGGSNRERNLDFFGLDGSGMRLIRSFPRVDIQRRDTRFEIFESGVTIRQGRHTGVYAFPDLREIEFKGTR